MLSAALNEALLEKKVENQSKAVDNLRVTSQRTEIGTYRPDVVLVVKATGGEPFYYQMFGGKCGDGLAGYSSLSYDVRVLEPDLDEPNMARRRLEQRWYGDDGDAPSQNGCRYC